MTWKRGVWFRQTGIVPYDRITNIDIYQGPLMRLLGFSLIKLQTAGYSGQKKAEITMEGIVEAEELRETIRSMIRETRKATGPTDGRLQPYQAGNFASAVPPRACLEEVRAIRNDVGEDGGEIIFRLFPRSTSIYETSPDFHLSPPQRKMRYILECHLFQV